MADDLQYSSRSDHKRKFDDDSPPPPGPQRRATGFSAPIVSPSPEAAAVPPASYSSAPAIDGIELAKQRAQEIAARLFSAAEAKRPRAENGSGVDGPNDYMIKPMGQQVPSQVGMTPTTSFPSYGYPGTSKKIDVPNGRVGVIIGKGGETIKYLQNQSGAKIQVTRDMDADPNSPTRTVELMGTSEQISKAEQLINDVLAEAESGGAGTVGGRRFGGVQGGTEQFIMKVPNNKVGLIIGKGGETIKNMQAKSGARIQLIPLHLPPGDTSTERTVQMDGTKEQIESAKQLVSEVTSENRVRNPQMGGGYSQQGYQPPRPPTSWGPPGPPPMQQPGYGYMQPGAYPGPPPQYNMSQSPYGSYPPQPASGGYSSGWDQSSNPQTQQTTPAAGYDYYNQQQQPQQPVSTSSAPADNSGYNYGQPPVYTSQETYGDGSYSQPATGQQQQTYGQDSYSANYQAPATQPGYSQPASNPQSGYDHQGYGSAPAYGAASGNTSQEGSAATYGAPSGPTSAPPPAQPSQGTAQPGYGQSVPLAQTNYGQSAQGQKPQPVYGQAPQPPTSQAGYIQQPGYGQLPPAQSGYAQPYGQSVPYGAAPSGQAGYGQQQQQAYGDSYSSGGYSQQPVYPSEGGANQAAGGTKASPQS